MPFGFQYFFLGFDSFAFYFPLIFMPIWCLVIYPNCSRNRYKNYCCHWVSKIPIILSSLIFPLINPTVIIFPQGASFHYFIISSGRSKIHFLPTLFFIASLPVIICILSIGNKKRSNFFRVRT